jgi:ribonuclease E
MFNDEDEEDEDDEGNNYKLNKGKSTKIIGGLEFDDDIEEDEDEDEEEDDELEDDIDEDDIDEDESYAEYDDFAE